VKRSSNTFAALPHRICANVKIECAVRAAKGLIAPLSAGKVPPELHSNGEPCTNVKRCYESDELLL